MINLRTESQGTIYSIKLSRENIKRGSFTLCSSLVLDFQYKGAKNGSVENKDCILGHFRVSLKRYIYNSRLIYIQEAKTEDMSFNFDTIENVHSLSINIKARGKYRFLHRKTVVGTEYRGPLQLVQCIYLFVYMLSHKSLLIFMAMKFDLI